MDFTSGVMLPAELRPYRQLVEAYTNAKLQRFAYAFAQRLNPNLTKEQIDYVAADALHTISAMAEPAPVVPQQNLRLVLRHDCLSSGCGDGTCLLCQFNPSRICKRNLKQKYLIDDHLRAKCGAGLRVEVVDENGQCMTEPVPDMELEVHVLNGEKYKEVCPDNTLLNSMQLRSCIIQPNHKKPLLKRETAMGLAEDVRIFLPVENGQAPLSDLQCTTSSEALLCGKAPTFRLLVWAIDRSGTHLPHITYVVSESFVVATKRVKHAIKSDIPSIGDHISKLVHIGKATVDKLQDIKQAAAEESMEIDLPSKLIRVDKVGQFRELVELTEANSDLKHKLRHLLKLSPEKWEEVTQHALSAVVPDFRPRVWWCPSIRGGLLFACKNGAVLPEHPFGYVQKDPQTGAESAMPLQQADAYLFNLLPKLKQQAMQDWFAPGHTGWQVYWNDPSDPLAAQMQPGPNGPGFVQQLPLGLTAQAVVNSGGADSMASASAAASGGLSAMSGMMSPVMQQQQQTPLMMGNGGLPQRQQQQQMQHVSQQPQSYAQSQPIQQYPPAGLAMSMQQQQQQQPVQQQMQQPQQVQSAGGALPGMPMPPTPKMPSSAPSTATAAAAAAANAFTSGPPLVAPVAVPLAGHQRHSVPGYGTARSPFATQNLQQTLSAAFPAWAASPGSTPHSTQGGAPISGGGATPGVSGGGAPPQQQQQQPGMGNGITAGQAQQQPVPQHLPQQQHQQLQQQYQMQPGISQQAAAAAAAAAAGSSMPMPGEMSSKLAAALPSLEMLNTEDLPPIDRGTSLWSLDSFQQMQMLAELPSVGVGSMLGELAGMGGHQGAAPAGAAAAAAAAAAQQAAAGDAGDQPDRALSLKFSMSLDLADVPDDLKSGAGN